MSAEATQRLDDSAADLDVLALDNQLCFPLYAAARLVVQAYRPFLQEVGLTYPQYLVLLALWEHDGLRVVDLGERLHLDSGTLTPLLQRLESLQHIVRRRRDDDGRAVETRLTDQGRALRARAEAIPIDLMCSVGLDMDEVLRIKAAVEPLVARLAAHARR